MQSNTSKTMFYSLLFAIGGAPTLAMWMIYIQTNGALEQHWTTLLALSFVLAAIIAPLILIQNFYILWKRKKVNIEDKIEPIAHFYFVLDLVCLVSWILISFL